MPDEMPSDEILARIRALAFQYPGVKEQKKFGYPAFFHQGRLFMFCPPGTVVLTRLMPSQIVEAQAQYQSQPFVHGDETHQDWCQIPVQSVDELRTIQYLIQTSYQAG